MQEALFKDFSYNAEDSSIHFESQSHGQLYDGSRLTPPVSATESKSNVSLVFLDGSKEKANPSFRLRVGSRQTWNGLDSKKRAAIRRQRLDMIPFFLSMSILLVIFLYIRAQVSFVVPILQYSNTNGARDPGNRRPTLLPLSDDEFLRKKSNTPKPPRIVAVVAEGNISGDLARVTRLDNATTTRVPAAERSIYEASSSRIRRQSFPIMSADTAHAYNISDYTAPIKPFRPQKHMVPSPLNLSNSTHNATKEDCQPILDWQTRSYPTCNMFHEMDMSYTAEDEGNASYYLGHGTIRDVWDVSLAATGDPLTSSISGVVLKTLRLSTNEGRGTATDLSFSPHRQDTHRHDAVASERLSSSPHVVDIYGYCAQSCLNEKLDETLVEYRRRHKEKDTKPLEILRLARDAAVALRDVHSVDYHRVGYVTIVHKDVTHRNFLMSSDGRTLKITDFNLSLFPLWDTVAEAPCGLRKSDCTTYRSPEECRGDVLDEKIDIYMLGNTFYYILTKKQPLWRVRIEAAKRRIESGETSVIPPKYATSDDPVHKLLIDVIHQCWAMNPKDRPNAAEVATLLSQGYDSILSIGQTAP